MSLFSKEPKTIKDFEKRIEKLLKKKWLSKRNAEKLVEYRAKLAELKAKEKERQQKEKEANKKLMIGLAAFFSLMIVMGVVSSCNDDSALEESPTATISVSAPIESPLISETPEPTINPSTSPATESSETITSASIPAYSGKAYVAVNGNVPYFTDADYTTSSYEYYSPLDSLGRCGVCVASIGKDIMPTAERGSIGSVKPTGWHTVKYDNVDGKYLYNRCHLIGYQLTGENANVKNLITGTRYLNISGMLPFENMVADYVKETGNHVLYRATPIFEGNNLLASGVLLEGYSVEDNGDGICFNVYCYNVQPGITINYADGDSSLESTQSGGTTTNSSSGQNTSQGTTSNTQSEQTQTQTVTSSYVVNTNTGKFHNPSCSSVRRMNESNKWYYNGSRDSLISQGYSPCQRCNP